MERTLYKKKRTNWLLVTLTSLSLGVHFIIFLYIAGIVKSETLTYIDLSIQNISKPYMRSIPRPSIRNNDPEKINIKEMNIKERRIPQLSIDPLKINPNDFISDSIEMPEIPNIQSVSGLKIAKWEPITSFGDFITEKDYFEMIKIKIEGKKEYPKSAIHRQREGKVKVKFIINLDGNVNSSEVTMSSGSSILDNAALMAVKNSSPFPAPPPNMFKKSINIEIIIVFELT
ncbi:MAG: energy transducer TonB [Desulfobacterales bacterium]|nr:energy transducer TonB [Desulfobacterales bacterium]